MEIMQWKWVLSFYCQPQSCCDRRDGQLLGAGLQWSGSPGLHLICVLCWCIGCCCPACLSGWDWMTFEALSNPIRSVVLCCKERRCIASRHSAPQHVLIFGWCCVEPWIALCDLCGSFPAWDILWFHESLWWSFVPCRAGGAEPWDSAGCRMSPCPDSTCGELCAAIAT